MRLSIKLRINKNLEINHVYFMLLKIKISCEYMIYAKVKKKYYK